MTGLVAPQTERTNKSHQLVAFSSPLVSLRAHHETNEVLRFFPKSLVVVPERTPGSTAKTPNRRPMPPLQPQSDQACLLRCFPGSAFASGLLPHRDVVDAVGVKRKTVPVSPAVHECHPIDARHEVELSGPRIAVDNGKATGFSRLADYDLRR